MFFNMKGTMIVLAVIALVIGICTLDLCCGGKPSEMSTVSRVKTEMSAGLKEMRNRQADDLAKVASDMRVLAKRYAAKGDKKQAQRAINAAQELEQNIQRLRREKEKQP